MIKRLTRPFRALLNFLRGIQAELKLMEWLKGKQLIKYTVVVVLYCVLLTGFIYIVDALLVAVRSGLLGQTSL